MTPTPPSPLDDQIPADPGLEALSRALGSSFRFLRGLMAAVAVLYLASGFFTIRQDELGFVMIGGKVRGEGPSRVLRPGAHWTWPRPFARVVRVPAAAREVRSDDFWYAVPGGRADAPPDTLPPPPARLHPRADGYLLSADASLFHARLALRYRIQDPEAVVFGLTDLDALLRAEVGRAALRAAAVTAVDEALRTDSEAFRKRVEDLVRERTTRLALGVEIDRVDLMAAPPRQAASAFEDVVRARLEAAKAVEQARAVTNRLDNEARAESDLRLSQAETYRTRVVGETASQVARFKAVLARYRENPQVMGSLLRQDSVDRALARAGERFVLPAGERGDELRVTLPRREAAPAMAPRPAGASAAEDSP